MDESWRTESLPILQEIADQERLDRTVNLRDVKSASSLSAKQVERVVKRLASAGYIKGIDATTFGGFDLLDIRLTERGLREVGEWPSNNPAAAFLEALTRSEQEAESTEVAERIRALRRAAAALPVDLLNRALSQNTDS